MERRTIIILIILGLIIGGYFLATAIFKSGDSTPVIGVAGDQQEENENIASNPYQVPGEESKATFPIGDKFLISTPGGTIETNNFFTKAEGYYPEMEALLAARNQKFQLVFYRNTGEFALTILQGVPSEAMPEIQEEVMNVLGVGKSSLCKLKISYLQEFDGGDLEDLGALPLCSSVLK